MGDTDMRVRLKPLCFHSFREKKYFFLFRRTQAFFGGHRYASFREAQRLYATSVCGLKLLVYAAVRPYAASVH